MRYCVIALLLAPPVFAQTPTPDYAPDEALLKSQNLPTKGPALLDLLRKRIPSPEVIEQFKKHVARTQSPIFPVRKEASDSLVKMGDVVRPLLENHLKEASADLETVRRLGQVLEHFPADKDFANISAIARLVRRDKPADSAKVLFDFIPYVTDEHVRQEVQRTINAVGDKDQLLALLKDENPSRRAAAAEALVLTQGDKVKDAITPLLKDAHPQVRYQLGLALVEQRDRAGLPLLIKSIEGPPQRVEYVLDMLYRAAGETAPPDYYAGAATVTKFVAKWEQWLDKHGAKVDLPKQMTRTELGFTVIATSAIGVKGKSKIFELAPDKSVRWEFDGPRNPYDVQILGPNRLLLAEYTERRVTERDFKGTVLWTCNLATYPVACQRLPNGHTFIVTRQSLLIVDRDGKDVFTHAANQGMVGTIVTATRLRNGNFVVISSGGRCHLLDQKGQELKNMHLGGNVYPIGGSVDVLPNGNVLVPLYTNNRLAEFDWTGKIMWQANVQGLPLSASRIANGNTLVSFMNNRVAELNPAGKEVWSYQTEGRAFRIRRR